MCIRDSTYAIAYKTKSMANLQNYETNYAPKLRDEYNSKFSSHAPTFRTIMRVEEEF